MPGTEEALADATDFILTVSVGSDGLHRSWPGPDAVCSWAGLGARLGTPVTGLPGRWAGLAGWAQLPHHPVPFLCQAALPSDAPTSWPPPVPSPQAGKGSDV